MDGQRFDFQDVEMLGAAALGKPGQRTFYVFAGDRRGWARLWLEKEEFRMLSAAIDEVLESLPEEGSPAGGRPDLLPEPAEPPSIEFKVARLALAWDEARKRLGLLAFESADVENEETPPTVACWASREQAVSLGERIQEVAAAGRPTCRLCGGPIDPEGHVCPRLNGHKAIAPE